WAVRKRFPSRTLFRWQTIAANDVFLEQKLGSIVPDVLFRVRGTSYIIEIRVAHAVSAEKKKKIEALGIPALEFDFSQMNRVVTKADIRKALVFGEGAFGQGRGEWVYHPEQVKAQREIDAEFLARKAAIKAQISREGEQLRAEWRQKQESELNEKFQEYK